MTNILYFEETKVKIVLAFLMAFFITFFSVPLFSRFLKRLGFFQPIRELGPPSHRSKKDIPTMGGAVLIASIFIPSAIFGDISSRSLFALLLTLFLFGVLGFFDDWKKVKTKKGLSIKNKFLFQFLLSSVCAFCIYTGSDFIPKVHIPGTEILLDIGLFYIPFIILVILSSSNSANLTDGLDGLCAGQFTIIFSTFLLISFLVLNGDLTLPCKDVFDVSLFCSSTIGANLGFLWYNGYPAEIFMGDVGSLGIGAAVGVVATLLKSELLLPIICFIFVLEALSVIIQVFSFRKFGKRVFKMAPLHHHFELCDIPETKLSFRSFILSIIFSVFALLILMREI